jgi:hypothetical protein
MRSEPANENKADQQRPSADCGESGKIRNPDATNESEKLCYGLEPATKPMLCRAFQVSSAIHRLALCSTNA